MLTTFRIEREIEKLDLANLPPQVRRRRSADPPPQDLYRPLLPSSLKRKSIGDAHAGFPEEMESDFRDDDDTVSPMSRSRSCSSSADDHSSQTAGFAPPRTVKEELDDLKLLWSEGTLDEEEFVACKRAILNKAFPNMNYFH